MMRVMKVVCALVLAVLIAAPAYAHGGNNLGLGGGKDCVCREGSARN